MIVVVGKYQDGGHVNGGGDQDDDDDDLDLGEDLSLLYVDCRPVKRINAKEHVVGWYSTGPNFQENDLDIHALFHEYFPYGVDGMLSGAATVFFAYIGFDSLAGTTEEAWFRELRSGILDSITPDQVMHCNSEEGCSQLVSILPATEAALLDWAINLMADVVQYEHYNKMNARNIVMVFAPNMTQMADPLTALIHAVQFDRLPLIWGKARQHPLAFKELSFKVVGRTLSGMMIDPKSESLLIGNLYFS